MFHNTIAVAALTLLATSPLALAGPGHGGGTEFGSPGKAADVDRSIEVDMGEMFFSLDEFEIEHGQTIRFIVTNEGRMVHEFALGTEETHDAHAQEMRKMMAGGMITTRSVNHEKMRKAGMMHDDPNSVLLEPGETGEMIWTFDGREPVQVSCNLPGHRQAGMKATMVPTEEHASR